MVKVSPSRIEYSKSMSTATVCRKISVNFFVLNWVAGSRLGSMVSVKQLITADKSIPDTGNVRGES